VPGEISPGDVGRTFPLPRPKFLKVIGLRIGPEGLEPEKEGLPSRSRTAPTPENLTGVADRHRGHLLHRPSLGDAWFTL
jgi:hypothetical protein